MKYNNTIENILNIQDPFMNMIEAAAVAITVLAPPMVSVVECKAL